MLRLPVIAFTLFFSNYIFADNSEKFELKNVQVGAISVSQSNGESYSGIIRYNPYYKLNEKSKVGASLDLSPLKLKDETTFISIGYLMNGHYQISEKLGVQVSAGLQTWTCTDCKTSFTAGLMGTYSYSPSWFKSLNQVFVQYLNVDQKSNTNQFVGGLTLNF